MLPRRARPAPRRPAAASIAFPGRVCQSRFSRDVARRVLPDARCLGGQARAKRLPPVPRPHPGVRRTERTIISACRHGAARCRCSHEPKECAMANARRLIGVAAGCVVLIGASWPVRPGLAAVARAQPGREGRPAFTAPGNLAQDVDAEVENHRGRGRRHARPGRRQALRVHAAGRRRGHCCAWTPPTARSCGRTSTRRRPSPGRPAAHPGPRSSPAVAEGKVVTLGVGGVLSCLDAADGKVVWRKDEFPRPCRSSSRPCRRSSWTACASRTSAGRATGRSWPSTWPRGKAKWKWTGDAPAYASPVLMTVDGTKQIVTLAREEHRGPWRWPTGSSCGRSPLPPRCVLQLGHADRRRPDGDLHRPGPGHQGREDREAGRRLRRQGALEQRRARHGHTTRPCSRTACSSGSPTAAASSASTPRPARRPGPTPTSAAGTSGPIVDAGSVLLALPSNGELIVFKPGDKQYEELARIKVAEAAVYAHPVVAGKRIYVKDQTSLALWTIE